jgi:hypothetical protein
MYMKSASIIFRIFAVILLGCSILSTICFVSAETPEEALKKGWAQMPKTWEAGVFSHGYYIQWLSLTKHPLLFALSVVGIAISGAFIYYLDKRTE